MARVEPLTLGLRPQKFLAMRSRAALVKRAVPLGLVQDRGGAPAVDIRDEAQRVPSLRRRDAYASGSAALDNPAPALVLIRSRNPWVRFRRKLLG